MVKQRMTAADVAAEVSCLRSKVIGMRLTNAYDISPKVHSGSTKRNPYYNSWTHARSFLCRRTC
jgi:predicted ribosome quality control (RQC) complex YloA/Tae2 family protein